ncbi:hypothetical protein Tco_1130106 [Tanacetum coccineum]
MTGVMTELILRECMEKAQAKSSLAKPKIDNNVKIELSKEHLKELRKTLTIDEGNDKITAWSDVVGRFLCKYYPLSHAGKYDVTRDDEDEGPDYIEFIIWLNSKCKDHKSMDGTTKTALWNYWLKEEGNAKLMDNIELSDEEWEESDYRNPRNTDTDSFFKPYLDAQEKDNIYEIEKGNERNQKYRGGNISKVNDIVLNNAPDSDNIKDEQLNERVCKAKKFEVIKYSLGPNEEYIAINTCECNAWKRNEYSVSHIYQEIF